MTPIRSVQRAIALITIISVNHRVSLSDLVKLSGLPKSTVHRLLYTLLEEQLIVQDTDGKRYSLHTAARRLTHGIDVDASMQPACMAAERITAETMWPCAIAVPNQSSMDVLYSTHKSTPMWIWPNVVLSKLPMLYLAIGQGYLAFCTPQVRAMHFDFIDAEREEVGEEPIDRRQINTSLDIAKEQGYAFRLSSSEIVSSSIALPIYENGVAKGSLTMTYLGRHVTKDEAIARYLPIIRDALEGGYQADLQSVSTPS